MNTATAIDPLAALTRSAGEDVTDLKRLLERVEARMRALDEKRGRLREAHISFDVDLGDVWNVAAAGVRQQASGAVRPTFALPTGAAKARDAA